MEIESGKDGIGVGRYLALLRDKAKLTQAELAKRITVSPVRISRIESGNIALTDDEIDQLLDAIGTDDAKALREYLDQSWEELERPPFDHPNREALWTINELLGRLRKLKADPKLNSLFFRHIEMYESELRSLGNNLSSTDHAVAFVGSIGVGKSTAICTMSELRIPNEGSLNKQMVLEVGAGGTTICEVHVKRGPEYGLLVEPQSDEAIKYDVADFAEYLLRLIKPGEPPVEAESEEGPGITKEINRAIRNMSNLTETKYKDPVTGRQVRNDRARELAVKHPDAKEIMIQVLSLMNLPRRDQRDIWYTPENKASSLGWLQQTFTEINNGRHPQFSLPQRIEVVIPKSPLDDENLNIRIIDTKGIDGAASRADLDRLFDDARTLIVLCSRFNDAPESALQQLLLRVKDAGARDIPQKTLMLVLPRPEEAIAVKDDSGMPVEDEQEGYDLKRNDVEMRLSQLGLQTLSVNFFNARQDDSAPLRTLLVERLREMRKIWEDRVQVLSKTVDDLIVNHKKQQTELIFREVMSRLNTWLSKNKDIEGITEQAQQQLVRAIQQAHWRSVWASVRRRGDWYNLDYYYEVGFGVRTITAKYVRKKASEFEIIVQNLLDDPGLAPAHDMLEQVKLVLRSKTDELLKKMEIVGRSVFEDELRADTELWTELEGESGQGYRNNIASVSKQWFDVEGRAEKHDFVRAKIVEGWREILSELDELFGQVVDQS